MLYPNKNQISVMIIIVFCFLGISEGTINAVNASTFPIESKTSPNFWTDLCFFNKADENVQIELYYSISMKELTFIAEKDKHSASFSVSVNVKNTADQIVFERSVIKVVTAKSLAETADEAKGVIDIITFELPTGQYNLNVEVIDVYANLSSFISSEFNIQAFGKSLTMSEIELASIISKKISQKIFQKGNQSVFPNPSRRFRYQDALLYFYFEVYNLDMNSLDVHKKYFIDYYITNFQGDSLIVLKDQAANKQASSCMKMQALNISALDRGEHVLTVHVKDPTSGDSVTRQRRFWVYEPYEETQILPMSEADIKRYRDQIKYLTTTDDLNIYDQLTPIGKENFLLQFWQSKDTNLSTEENEFMQEHFRRIHYANLYFKGRQGGINTDMGRVYIVYGPPDEVEFHEWKIGAKAHQIWYYRTDINQHFVFVDRGNEGIYYLVHSTVVNETHNENWMEAEVLY